MKNAIKLKIEAALAKHRRELQERISEAEQIEEDIPDSPPTPRYNLRVVETDVHATEKFWTVAEIVKRHGVSKDFVRDQLKGKPGWLQFKGGTVRITEGLYREWIRDAITRSLKN